MTYDQVVATRIGLRGTRVETAHFADVRIVPVVRAGHPLAGVVARTSRRAAWSRCPFPSSRSARCPC